MNFDETLILLGEMTKEIDVVASKCWKIGGANDIAIRSGSAPIGVDFHDPIIDNSVFMICGDIFTIDHKREENFEEFVDRYDEHYVRLRAVSGIPFSANIDLGRYEIESMVPPKGDNKYFKHALLKLKRTGML